ncbi:MAG: ORF6N domain-containing protein [Chitinivibrionales bacterium]|nr:ORF6N domain-containing protein [Chitinivibrionales bacterium]
MTKNALILSDGIQNRIYSIRGIQVMIDRDLAELYQVETKALNQAAKRNIDRFPNGFMFQLTSGEVEYWKSQFVTSNREKMGLRKLPYAFTEQGVAMLAGVLKSGTAVKTSIQIIVADKIYIGHFDPAIGICRIIRKNAMPKGQDASRSRCQGK